MNDRRRAAARRVGTDLRPLVVPVVATTLVGALAGGLLRAGLTLPVPTGAAWPAHAAAAHGFLMMVAFLGTVIGIERAVAVRRPWAVLAPAGSAMAGVLMLAGASQPAAALAVIAGLVFVAVNATLVSMQRAAHTVLLLVSALALLAGNVSFAFGAAPSVVLPWWCVFLALTIAAERLEMARLMRRRRGAAALFQACTTMLLVGAVAGAAWPVAGGVLFGVALLALSAWFFVYDVARRTLRADGLSRYMAVCLLAGYGWLAVAGVAWAGTALGLPWRDAALHAFGLGFVFGMVLGHAPVILPALAGIRLRFGPVFYLPLVLLHGSLAARLAGGAIDFDWRQAGAVGNALSLAAFAATLAGAALAWNLRQSRARRMRDACASD